MNVNVDLHVDLPDGSQAHIHGTISEGEAAQMTLGESAATWLAPIDAGELEKEVMGRVRWGAAKPIALALDVLKEWAEGRVAAR